jgi:hypothetical protein
VEKLLKAGRHPNVLAAWPWLVYLAGTG